MTQYQVPQFIELEDRIIGPLTLKQFLYLAFAAALLFVLWFLLQFYLWIIIATPTIAIAVAFAFLKVNDRPLVYFFLSFVRYFTSPKLYLFSSGVPAIPVPSVPVPDVAPALGAKGQEVSQRKAISALGRSQIKELALNLDIGK